MLNAYIKIMSFITEVLPLAVWGILVVTIFLMFLKDRRNRKLQLQNPPEISELQQLHDRKLIDDQELALLQSHCSALPTVEEIAPVPTLALRMAIAVSKIYGVMQIVLVSCAGLCALVMLLLHYQSNQTMDVSTTMEHPLWLLLLFLLTLVLGIVQFLSAGKILSGSLKARNLCCFCWLLNFGIINYHFYSSYWMPAAGIFALYILLFRKNANRAISSNAVETSWKRKLGWAIMCCLLLLAGQFANLRLNLQSNASFLQSSSSFSSCSGNEIVPYLQTLYLVAASPEPETQKVLEAIAKKLEMPCKVIPFGAPLLQYDEERDLVLYLDRGIGQALTPLEIPNLPGAPQLDWKKLWQKSPNFSPMWEFSQLDHAGDIVYELCTLQGSSFHQRTIQSLIVPDFSWGLTGNVAINHDNSPNGIDKVAQLFVDKIAPQLQSFRGANAVQLPPIPDSIQNELPLLNIPELPEMELIAQSRSLQSQGNALYRIPCDPTRPEAVQQLLNAVTNTLKEKLDLEAENSNWSLGKIRFEQRNEHPSSALHAELRFDGAKPNEFSLSGIPRTANYAFLLLQGNSSSHPAEEAQFVQTIRNGEVRTLALLRGLPTIADAKERQVLAEAYFALPDESLTARSWVLNSLKRSPDMQELFEREFLRLGVDLIADPHSPNFRFNLLQQFRDCQDKLELRNRWIALLQNHYQEFIVPDDTPTDEIWQKREFSVPLENIHDFFQIVVLKFPTCDYQDLELFLSNQPNADGTQTFCTNNHTINATAQEATSEASITEYRVSRYPGDSKPYRLEGAFFTSGDINNHHREKPGETSALQVILALDETQAQAIISTMLRVSRKERTAVEEALSELPKAPTQEAQNALRETIRQNLESLRNTSDYLPCIKAVRQALPDFPIPELHSLILRPEEPSSNSEIPYTGVISMPVDLESNNVWLFEISDAAGVNPPLLVAVELSHLPNTNVFRSVFNSILDPSQTIPDMQDELLELQYRCSNDTWSEQSMRRTHTYHARSGAEDHFEAVDRLPSNILQLRLRRYLTQEQPQIQVEAAIRLPRQP